MNNSPTNEVVRKLAELRVFLNESDPDKTYFWLECIRAQLGSDNIGDNHRNALLRIFIKQLSMVAVQADKTFSFYRCYAMRAFFSLGDFNAENMKVAERIYQQLDKIKVLEVLDVHFFWQRLHGYPKKFDRILEQAKLQLSNSSSEYSSNFLMMIKKAHAHQNYTELSNLDYAPKQILSTSWDELPWFKWQWNTMQSMVCR